MMPRGRLLERLRAYLLAGVLITGPVALTLYITWLIVHFIDQSVALLIPAAYNPATYVPFPGFGLVIGVIGLTLIGWITAGFLGRWVVRFNDRVLARMPVVRSLYGTTKQIFETVLAKRGHSFREVVLVEFPRPGVWTIGFVTAELDGEVKAKAGADAVAVYVSTTPNPTSGYLLFVSRRQLIPLAMSVEDGIKLVISLGIVTPHAVLAEAPREIAQEQEPVSPNS
jgi:uncharacterized membrane protein